MNLKDIYTGIAAVLLPDSVYIRVCHLEAEKAYLAEKPMTTLEDPEFRIAMVKELARTLPHYLFCVSDEGFFSVNYDGECFDDTPGVDMSKTLTVSSLPDHKFDWEMLAEAVWARRVALIC